MEPHKTENTQFDEIVEDLTLKVASDKKKVLNKSENGSEQTL